MLVGSSASISKPGGPSMVLASALPPSPSPPPPPPQATATPRIASHTGLMTNIIRRQAVSAVGWRAMASKWLLVIAALAAACGGGGSGVDGGADAPVCQDDPRSAAFIYHGTTQPTYAPLTAGQVLAIGAWSDSAAGGGSFC